jgi:hypothetical protein
MPPEGRVPQYVVGKAKKRIAEWSGLAEQAHRKEDRNKLLHYNQIGGPP